MDINIRKAIIDNFKNFSNEELHQTIDEAIKSQEEKVLPGLGVFLELIWDNSSIEFKQEIISKLSKTLSK
ncbi:MAG: small acid-soluble spore protein SspI [Bacilli bacterium]|nr:small acid-soluble spore protein SspI [Bacilli bacterium]